MSAVSQMWPDRSGSPDLAVLFAAVEAFPGSLAVVESGVVLYANPAWARMFELVDTSQGQGRAVEDFIPGHVFHTLRPGRSPAELVHVCRHVDMRIFMIACAGFRVRGSQFQVVSALDAGPQNPAEADLREAQRLGAVGRLAGGVAHDFNNLLTGIMLYCDLLIAELQEDTRSYHHARKMRMAGEHGAKLVQQLLAVARPKALESHVFALNEVVAGIEELLTRLIGENIVLNTSLARDLAAVRMDPAHLQQILLNLVLNARDAMPEGGHITLAMRNCTWYLQKNSEQRADSAEHAYRILETQNIDVVLLDLKLPGAGGLEALHQIGQRKPDAVTVVVTRYGTVQSAVQAMKNGAYDYVTKPFSMEELRLLLERVSGHLKLKTENRTLREKIKSKLGFGSIVGRSPEMERLYRMIAKAAHSSHPVLIPGESGTGKEMVARSIHFSGPFRNKPFIPVDCGSLVPTLIEGELFGYVKGAFTGAVQSRDGLLAIAEGGTVFLDEVGELPVDLQAKLLRSIQEREIRPVGSTKRISINVRILAATNRDLEQAVAQGTFRRDLYFRLNVLSLKIPPLRERRQDIPLLTSHFLERLSRALGHERTLNDGAMKALLAYDWPGNVRERENCLERACAFSSGPVIQIGDLPSAIHGIPGPIPMEGNGSAKILPMAELEKQTILGTIAQLNGDKLVAARMLGIGKTTLYRKLKEYVTQD